jgi:hypothetical protein
MIRASKPPPCIAVHSIPVPRIVRPGEPIDPQRPGSNREPGLVILGWGWISSSAKSWRRNCP